MECDKSIKYNKENCIVWMDMELTGLDVEKHKILEVACFITDQDLNVISGEFDVVINHSDLVLKDMDKWNTDHHTKSGLIQESRSSKISLKDTEQMLLTFFKKYIPEKSCPLAGNTIHMDRIFLIKHMPLVNNYLHYRIIDVSSIKELVKRWNPNIYNDVPKKQLLHRGIPDIRESLEELKYYKQHIFQRLVV